MKKEVGKRVNLIEMEMIRENLEEKKYLLDQELKTEQIELESLDLMIRRVENQL